MGLKRNHTSGFPPALAVHENHPLPGREAQQNRAPTLRGGRRASGPSRGGEQPAGSNSEPLLGLGPGAPSDGAERWWVCDWAVGRAAAHTQDERWSPSRTTLAVQLRWWKGQEGAGGRGDSGMPGSAGGGEPRRGGCTVHGGLTRSALSTAMTQPRQLEEEPPNLLSQPGQPGLLPLPGIQWPLI